jgi:hypothetical protein
MKKKTTWHEYGLGLWLVLALIHGIVYSGMSHGDWSGAFGFALIPIFFWIAFYWVHYWRKKLLPLSWGDTILGIIAWMGVAAILMAKH